jgi:glycosyltransferase involved in cell wall biosynthesis
LNHKSIKILFYFNSLQPSGGIERVIVTLANKLCNKYDITILVKDNPISFYALDNKIKLISLNNPMSLNMNNQLTRIFTTIRSIFENYIGLKKFIIENKFDYYYLAHPLNVFEFHISRGVKKNDTIVTEHGAPNAYNIIYKKIKLWLYNKSKIYIVPTTTDTLYYNENNISAKYLPHFKSVLLYEKAKPDENIALSIGRFTDVKQQILLLQIWNSLVNHRNILNWKLHIVGEGELFHKFKEYIRVNNLQDFVYLLPPKQEVEYYYKLASIFLLSSKSEGFGMVLLEAISFGLPCISFDCPSGPRDIIHNNENGFLIPQDNVRDFEDSLINLIFNPDLIKEMSEKSFNISKNWDDDKLLIEWYNILQ